MKSICFYFKIHQPYRLKRYRFFDIGNDHYYYDDFSDDEIMSRVAQNSYIPMADTLLEMINHSNGEFKCSISISGTAIEQFQMYVPEYLDKLKQLADTGCVEFLSGPYSNSLSSIEDPEEFMREVKLHDDTIYRLFGKRPEVFANTELIFDDDVATQISALGFRTCLTDGAKHVLGWKSPNYVYRAATAPSVKILLTNDKLSADISENFNNPMWDQYPLTADKYVDWISSLPNEEQIVNLYFNMDTFGNFIPASTGIFEFLKSLPHFGKERGLMFVTPSEAVKRLKPIGELSIADPISVVDEARDVSAWTGNELQREALRKLYSIAERVNLCSDRRLKQDFLYLQSCDHFYYMSTKKSGGSSIFSPYDSPYAAFTNYMNVLSDFLVRVEEQYPDSIDNEELNSLLLTIRNQAAEITELKKEVTSLRTDALNIESKDVAVAEAKPAKKVKASAKKAKSKVAENK